MNVGRELRDLHCIEDADDDQTESAVGIVAVPREQANGLADGCGGREGEDEDPGTSGAIGVRNGSDTGPETETLEHLVEQDGDEQDDEAVSGDGDGHADEDAVEEDATLEQRDVEGHPPQHLGIHLLLQGIRLEVGHFGAGSTFLGLLAVLRQGSRAVVVPADEVQHLGALPDVLLVEDDEPRWHLAGRLALVGAVQSESR